LPDKNNLVIALNGFPVLSEDVTFDTQSAEVVLTTPPLSGTMVTAGFEFDVPVRFDTDQLDIALEAFGAGQLINIPLIEVSFTDHDKNILWDGINYEASSGLTPSEVDRRLGFSIDNGAVQGALQSGKISDADIAAGLYENAVMDCFRVNWKDTSQSVNIKRA